MTAYRSSLPYRNARLYRGVLGFIVHRPNTGVVIRPRTYG